MLPKRKRRLYFIILLISGMSISVGFALFALRQNINLYYTPQQLLQQSMPSKHAVRLGGMVVKNSIKRQAHSTQVSFELTDYHAKIKVIYDGILPSLFREEQGIVAQGHLNKQGVFIADQVLAKHDSTYKPPGMNIVKNHDRHSREL